MEDRVDDDGFVVVGPDGEEEERGSATLGAASEKPKPKRKKTREERAAEAAGAALMEDVKAAAAADDDGDEDEEAGGSPLAQALPAILMIGGPIMSFGGDYVAAGAVFAADTIEAQPLGVQLGVALAFLLLVKLATKARLSTMAALLVLGVYVRWTFTLPVAWPNQVPLHELIEVRASQSRVVKGDYLPNGDFHHGGAVYAKIKDGEPTQYLHFYINTKGKCYWRVGEDLAAPNKDKAVKAVLSPRDSGLDLAKVAKKRRQRWDVHVAASRSAPDELKWKRDKGMSIDPSQPGADGGQMYWHMPESYVLCVHALVFAGLWCLYKNRRAQTEAARLAAKAKRKAAREERKRQRKLQKQRAKDGLVTPLEDIGDKIVELEDHEDAALGGGDDGEVVM